ncbi:MAG: hypothetical protein HY905_07685 [Deltaproteobacteria bacterium]|nr:hypothetical protein [Deltaproteobacteria bacterium]
MKRTLGAVPLLAVALAAPPAAAEEVAEAPPPPSCADEGCVLATARAMLEADREEEAARWLLEQVNVYPDSGPIQILLGAAQLRSAEPLWAIDTFSRRLEQAPDDCEARTWLAWSWLQFAAVEEAEAVLDEGECGERDPWAARVDLLRAFALRSADDDPGAREQLEAARRRDEAFPADLDALDGFLRSVAPDRLPELAWRIDIAGGYTTNALLGAPTDPAHADVDIATDSPVVTTDVWMRFTPDFGFWLKPTLELMPKLQIFPFEDVREQSYVDLSGRVGVYLDWDLPRILLAYRPSYLLLFGAPGEAPVWYYASHRAEVEAEITSWLMAFAGAGHRAFDELGRTRDEVDGGFGGSLEFVDDLFILWTVVARGMWARDPAYNVGGVTGSFHLQYRWAEGFSSRAGVTVAGDWYPDSEGAEAFGEGPARADLFVRAGYQLWSPALWGFRLGVSYDYSFRDSTLPAFDFDDHRVLLKLTWSGETDLAGPSASDASTTADFDWGVGGGESALLDRVQDLLRQEEQVFRSCGCAE